MSALFAGYLEILDKKLHEKNCKVNEYFEKAEQATGVKRVYLALGLIAIWALYMILGHGAELICNAIGFAYPAYVSMHAIESSNKEDDTRWLTYWVTFAAFSLLEFFSEIILDFVPFYWLLKCLFLVWCFAPISNNGSQFLYHRFIRPVFMKHKGAIDDTLNKAASGVAGLAKDAAGKVLAGAKTD
ncbi:receptor expression-enhancing protein 5 isoform X1 [Parasteatoda tepidariorum]|uniref:receptor expression-enhancing protein 5 isoform X1 n=1 Tax=Parasteatoda tepidariorum TaxID=114398 RepID=UPI00077FD8C2|nr:receptor expression-enhancing protein 5 isoform X2 [Parasteatoda tepidariorum]